MTDRPGRRALLFALTILTLFPVAAAGAEEAMPVKLDTPAFSVRMTDAEGLERDFFGPGNPAYFDISFALSLSAANRYATTITLILGAGGDVLERVLFQGTLEEGLYQYFVPAGELPSDHLEGTAKVIMKTRFFPKKFTGESIYVYRRWEGAYRIAR
jgi:hypothetical protein